MIKRCGTIAILTCAILFAGCESKEMKREAGKAERKAKETVATKVENPKMQTEAEWKKKLTPEQYRVLRQAGTERPFTGTLTYEKRDGAYHCAGCGELLFYSDAKFESGCGWPSFFDMAKSKNITTHVDRSLGMQRTEIRCSNCGGHLGHVFNDGPRPTGLRYCVNSVSLDFKPKNEQDHENGKNSDAGNQANAGPAPKP